MILTLPELERRPLGCPAHGQSYRLRCPGFRRKSVKIKSKKHDWAGYVEPDKERPAKIFLMSNQKENEIKGLNSRR
jgi:hypothetical protein